MAAGQGSIAEQYLAQQGNSGGGSSVPGGAGYSGSGETAAINEVDVKTGGFKFGNVTFGSDGDSLAKYALIAVGGFVLGFIIGKL